MIKLIMFDMDDTLYNEKDYVVSGFQEVAKYLNKKYTVDFYEAYSSLLESFIAKGRGRNFDDIIEKKSLSPKIISDLVKIYREHRPNICLREDVVFFLRKLSEKHKLCLITDGWCEVQKKKVEALGLKEYFDLIIYSQKDGIEYAKPHSKFFLKAMKFFKVPKEKILMVGDDYSKDVVGAERIGIRAILIGGLLDKSEQEKIKRIIKKYERN